MDGSLSPCGHHLWGQCRPGVGVENVVGARSHRPAAWSQSCWGESESTCSLQSTAPVVVPGACGGLAVVWPGPSSLQNFVACPGRVSNHAPNESVVGCECYSIISISDNQCSSSTWGSV